MTQQNQTVAPETKQNKPFSYHLWFAIGIIITFAVLIMCSSALKITSIDRFLAAIFIAITVGFFCILYLLQDILEELQTNRVKQDTK